MMSIIVPGKCFYNKGGKCEPCFFLSLLFHRHENKHKTNRRQKKRCPHKAAAAAPPQNPSNTNNCLTLPPVKQLTMQATMATIHQTKLGPTQGKKRKEPKPKARMI